MTMSSLRIDVQWSPTSSDQFLTHMWGTELQLYQAEDVDPTEVVSLPRISLSSKTVASPISSNKDLQYVKCVSWCPSLESDPCHQLVAVGQANGKVVLTSFSKIPDPRGIKGKEYVQKHTRPVNSLAWSVQEPQLLSAGLERIRSDHCVIVWDVTRASQPPSYISDQRNVNASDLVKPVAEYGINEVCHSVMFSLHADKTLIAGMNNKQLRMFDLREGKLVATANTKAVFGLCADPHNHFRLASYIENQIYIWDVRNFDRPIQSVNDTKQIIKAEWCPTRVGLLASLSRDSTYVRLYDIQHYGMGSEDQDTAVISRSISTDANTCLSGFSWHPKDENRIITASYTGRLVDYVVHERITVNWSTQGTLVWTHGKKMLQFMDADQEAYDLLQDMSTTIMKRAQMNYGLKVGDLAANGDICANDSLRNLWSWLSVARKLVMSPQFTIPSGGPYKYQGVVSFITANMTKSELTTKPWIGIEVGNKAASCAKVFRSEARTRALELCTWGFESDSVLSAFLTHLENGGHVTRAAAVAVFNQRIRQALQILQRGATARKDLMLNTTAMALAGFTEDSKGLWRETCSNLRSQLTDPYLRAIFAFMTNNSETYETVLDETEMMIQDRVAFSCLYLNDTSLIEYLENISVALTEKGNLDGILLTGLRTKGVDLLQRYVDLTGDVQTVALIGIHTASYSSAKDNRFSHWVDSYRSLLDSLRLWNERAQLDVIMNTQKQAEKPSQNIYMTCNFCMKGISTYIQVPGRPKNPYAKFGTGSGNKAKMQSCPSCRKPLPRCALCLVHMGTPSGYSHQPTRDSISNESNGERSLLALTPSSQPPPIPGSRKLSDFSAWFTWCQTCRHGGHAHHMMEWFREHSECPVTSCSCKCMSIDTANKVASSAVVTNNNK